MKNYVVTLLSGEQFRVDAQTFSQLQQSMIGVGVRAMPIVSGDRKLFLSMDAIAMIEIEAVDDAAEGAPAHSGYWAAKV